MDMGTILRIDEMLAAARDSKMPGASVRMETIVQLADDLAHEIAAHLGIVTRGAHWDEPELAGIAGSFYAAHEGQEPPECIEQFDPGNFETDPLTRA